MRRWQTCVILLCVLLAASFVPAVAATDFAVKLKAGALTPARTAQPAAALSARTNKHVFIQFDHILTDSERESLQSAGIQLLDYIPENTYTAKVSPGLSTSQLARAGIRWVGDINAEYKISERILAGIQDYARRGGNKVQYTIVMHPDQSPDDWAREFATRYGATIVGIERSINSVEMIVDEPAYDDISRLDEVAWVELAPPTPVEHNNSSRANLGVPTVWAAPLNLNGDGITVAQWDGGRAELTHPDFAGRIAGLDGSAVSAHATHVAGTVLGSGAVSGGTYAGMAPGANLATQQWWNSGSEASAEYNEVILFHDAQIGQNSWGYGVGNVTESGCQALMGSYTTESATMDNIVRGSTGKTINIVFSAGNERSSNSQYCGSIGWTYNTVDPLAGAKNVITVGAINSNNSTMTSFSSWGPTDDGRIKPDVVGPGCQSDGDNAVTSTIGSSYGQMCGTSMSAPAISGVLALMYEQWFNTQGSLRPYPSTMKGILINSAIDQGRFGPDYQYGHGRVDAVAACKKVAIGAPSYVQAEISTSETHSYDLTVPSSAGRLRVNVVWDDPGGAISSSKHLKNDLDLVLVDPFNNEVLPWTVNPASPSANAVQAVDRTNNVETVDILNPQPGLWKARVTGFNIPTGPQKYSIVFSPDSINTPGNQRVVAVYTSPDQVLNSGSQTSVSFWVSNVGAALDSFHIQITDTANWRQSSPDTVVTLAPFDSVQLAVAINIPPSLLAGRNTAVVCHATNLTDTVVTATRQTLVTVAAEHAINLVQPNDTTVTSPVSFVLNLQLQNLGNATNAITVTPTDQRGWGISPASRQVSVPPLSNGSAGFTFTVPAEEPHQITNQFTFTATSTGGPVDVTTMTFTVYNPFLPPSLIAPEARAYVATGTPQFVWNRNGGVSFRLFVATDTTIGNVLREYTGITDTTFTLPPGDALPDGQYYWAVRLYAGPDSSSLQRNTRRMVVDRIAPNSVALLSPIADFDTAAYTYFTLQVTSQPPVTVRAPEYNRIEVAPDTSFSSGVTVFEPIDSAYYVAASSLPEGRLYWRAQRKDSSGNASGYSSVASFVRDITAPAIPHNLFPAAGKTVKGDSIAFGWTPPLAVPHEHAAEYFFLHISSQPNFSEYDTFFNNVYNDTVKVPKTAFQENTLYYWRVLARDSAGLSSGYGTATPFRYLTYICGDMNVDLSGPDLSDLQKLIDYLFFNQPAPPVIEAASVDCDGQLDISDLSVLIDFLFFTGDLCCQ